MPSVSSAGMPWLTTIRKPMFSSACRSCAATPPAPRFAAPVGAEVDDRKFLARRRAQHVEGDRRAHVGHLVQGGADVAHGDPAQVAHPGLVEMPAAVHRAAVVPDHQVALAPLVAVDELAAGGVLDQLAQQQPPVGQRPADDLRGVRRHVEGLAAGAGMGAYQALRHRRPHVLLPEQQLGEAELGARPGDVVHCHEVVDLGLCRRGQRIVGGAQIGEFGVAVAERARSRHAVRVQHRQHGRDPAERPVGVPQPVAELVEPARVVAAAQPARFVEVGNVGHFRPQPPGTSARPLRGNSSSPKLPANAICRSSSRFWPGRTSTAYRSIASVSALTVPASSGRPTSIPVTSPRTAGAADECSGPSGFL